MEFTETSATRRPASGTRPRMSARKDHTRHLQAWCWLIGLKNQLVNTGLSLGCAGLSQRWVFAKDIEQQSADKEPKSDSLLGTDRTASWAVPVAMEYIQVAMSAALDAAKPASCRINGAANSRNIPSTALRKIQVQSYNYCTRFVSPASRHNYAR